MCDATMRFQQFSVLYIEIWLHGVYNLMCRRVYKIKLKANLKVSGLLIGLNIAYLSKTKSHKSKCYISGEHYLGCTSDSDCDTRCYCLSGSCACSWLKKPQVLIDISTGIHRVITLDFGYFKMVKTIGDNILRAFWSL